MATSKRADFIGAALLSRSDDCIEWPFARRKSSGYGAHSTRSGGRKKNHDVHRYVCEIVHGAPALGREAAHTCGNKLCLNPRHLYWATHEQNMADAVAHGTLKGGGRYRQKIFAKDVRMILDSRESYSSLAAKYGVDVPYIGRIRRINNTAFSAQ